MSQDLIEATKPATQRDVEVAVIVASRNNKLGPLDHLSSGA
jgi:hypothetical protein